MVFTKKNEFQFENLYFYTQERELLSENTKEVKISYDRLFLSNEQPGARLSFNMPMPTVIHFSLHSLNARCNF